MIHWPDIPRDRDDSRDSGTFKISRAKQERDEIREATRKQAAKAALRCLSAAFQAYWEGDEAAVDRWMVHIEKLSKIVKEGPSSP